MFCDILFIQTGTGLQAGRLRHREIRAKCMVEIVRQKQLRETLRELRKQK